MTKYIFVQVGTCWGLGLIIGPALGGYLSQVCPLS